MSKLFFFLTSTCLSFSGAFQASALFCAHQRIAKHRLVDVKHFLGTEVNRGLLNILLLIIR